VCHERALCTGADGVAEQEHSTTQPSTHSCASDLTKGCLRASTPGRALMLLLIDTRLPYVGAKPSPQEPPPEHNHTTALKPGRRQHHLAYALARLAALYHRGCIHTSRTPYVMCSPPCQSEALSSTTIHVQAQQQVLTTVV